MTGELIKAVIDKIPSWVFSIIGIGIVLLFFYISFLLSKGARQISNVLDKENNIKEMQENIRLLEKDKEFNKGLSSQFSTALENIGAHIRAFDAIKNNGEGVDIKLFSLLGKMTDTLASDVKFKPGEKHRCGFWLFEDEERLLRLTHASAGFPAGYVGSRTLSVDQSIAGRAYRLKRIINEPNVEGVMEWSKSPNSGSRYKAVIAIPVGDFGVLTIDAMEEMIRETEAIGEAYASLFELVAMELFNVYEDDLEEFHETELEKVRGLLYGDIGDDEHDGNDPVAGKGA